MNASVNKDQAALEIIFSAIDLVFNENRKIPKEKTTALLGAGSYVDSLQLINLLVCLDDLILERTGTSPRFTEDETLLDEMGALRTIGTLANYIEAHL